MACAVGKRDNLLPHLERHLLHTQAWRIDERNKASGEYRIGIGIRVGKPIECGLTSASRIHHEGPFGRIYPGETPCATNGSDTALGKRVVATSVKNDDADSRSLRLKIGQKLSSPQRLVLNECCLTALRLGHISRLR